MLCRLTVPGKHMGVWVQVLHTKKTRQVIEELGARYYSTVDVIIFKCVEDITVFRLKADSS